MMYPSVRDAILLSLFPTIGDGLDATGLDALELVFERDCSARAIRPADGADSFKLDSPDGVEAYRRHLADHGVKAWAFRLGTNYGRDDLDGEVAWTVAAIRAAAGLGMPAVNVDPIMSGEQEAPREKNVRVFADAISRALDATADTGVDVGIENHGFQGNMPEFLDDVLNRVGSSRLGMTIDTGNFYWRGHPLSRVYEAIEHFAPHCKHTHVKNIAYPPEVREVQREMGWKYGTYVSPLRDGDIDLRRLVQILKAAGYDRDFCIEDESLGRWPREEAIGVLKQDVEFVKEIL